MTSIFSRAAVAFALLAGALIAHATQTVFPASDASGTVFSGGPVNGSVSKFGGQQLIFYGRYDSTNPTESGLGLKIQFDPTKILSVTVDQVLTKCIVSYPPDASVAGQVIFAWADTSVRNPPAVGWPTLADGAPPEPVPPFSAGCVTLPGPPPGYVQTTAGVPIPTNLFRFTATTAAGFTSGNTTITLTSTGAGPFTATSLQVNGTVAPPCNLDVDNSGGTPTAGVDGVLTRRALNNFILAANIPNNITFPGTATRTVGADIRSYVLGMGNILDVDGNGASTPVAGVDGLLIQRALNTFITSANVPNNITTPATGAQVRTYLNNNCGTSLTP
ncbi:MAG: hypothetical protein IPI73_08600 [Betaproteobacteria bacterium]|nr:hypothetical protein [Betaproteobacteria bacterium]